jgi:1,4-dihydroxy-2-naphthoate octaprenyltransferase
MRPKTLTASLVPILVATALVSALGFVVHWWVTFLALACSLLIQIGTNLVNDAVDFKKGADTHARVGPMRVTQSGLLTIRVVAWGAGICFLLAALLGIPLVIQGGWTIVMIGLASIACGYMYTGGPFPLAYLGLGDLFVILFFGLVAVGGLFFLHVGFWTWEAALAGCQVGFLATVLIAINNFRDARGDALVKKETLAVRWGPRFARFEIAFLCCAPFAMNLAWLMKGWYLTALLPLMAVPLAILISRNVFRTEPGVRFNNFLGQAALLHLLFGILISIGLVLDRV